MTNADIFLTLNGLIGVCEQAERGYRAAADRAHEPLKPVFLEYCRQRSRFVSELQEIAREIGGDRSRPAPARVPQELHETDTAAIVSACERHEEAAMSAYRRALETQLPNPVYRVVDLQFRDVKDAYERLRMLQMQRRSIPTDEEMPGTETEGAPD